jgi:hypothetical protein
LCVYAFLARWIITASPAPRIDVYAFHEEAFRVLSRHGNPYAVDMPNIYGHTMWYAPGFATGDHVLVGFLYPPLSLALTWLGKQAGDYRYASAAAVTLAGFFLARARGGRLGLVAAALLLFTPRGLFVLEQGWTEPLVVLFLAATIYSACRAPKAVPWVFGLLLAVKQYGILLFPLSVLLVEKGPFWRKWLTFATKAVATAAVVTLPGALPNLRAFVNSVVLFQGRQPFRSDALSYAAWSAVDGVPRLPGWASFAAALVALGLCLWRAPRTPAGFATSTCLVLLCFFAFAKQAFCNYYYVILAAGCCAVAALRPERPRPGAEHLVSPGDSRLWSDLKT